ncbi:hypothetical protein [Burkholderia sp. USMB20]|nr:hypothetical protein [Burkholderia sp. USMB20]
MLKVLEQQGLVRVDYGVIKVLDLVGCASTENSQAAQHSIV